MTFHQEFAVLVSEISATYKNILIFQDFNFHFDKQENSDTKQLLELLNSTGLSHRICQPTHYALTGSYPALDDQKTISSRPHPFNWCWRSPPVRSFSCDSCYKGVTPRLQKWEVRCRHIKGMDSDAFRRHLSQSSLVQSPPSGVEGLVTLDNKTLLTRLDKHSPVTLQTLPGTTQMWVRQRRRVVVRRDVSGRVDRASCSDWHSRQSWQMRLGPSSADGS